MLGIWSILFFISASGQSPVEVQIQPLDMESKGHLFPLRAIHQLETDGERLFVRSMQDARVLVLNKRGQILFEMGRKGNGPGEWGSTGIQAMALSENELWGFGTHRMRVNTFRDGQFQGSFDISELRPGHQGATSNVFGISQTHIAVPSAFQTDYLAIVYSKAGTRLGKVGTPLVEEKDLLAEQPFANDTMWIYAKDHWYALFKFYPVIAVFDKYFKKQSFFNLDHPFISQAFGFISEDHGPDIILPLFSDVKFFANHLYLMCMNGMLQLDLNTLEVTSLTRFIGKGPHFGEAEGKPLTLPFFSFLNDGTLVLAHPMALWQHDLWTVPKAALSHLKIKAGS